MKVMGHPVEHFNVPHPAPAEVEQASAKFEETSAAFQAARTRFYQLKTDRLDDIAAANLAAAKARLDGTKPPALTPSKVDQRIAEAETEMAVLSQATDVAGTALVRACAKHRDAWLATFVKAEDEATRRAADLIRLTEQATNDLSTARRAAGWLRDFTGVGQTQFSGHGHSVADFSELEKLVHGERRLIGYRDGEAIWETVKA